jgi:hypothetical protein
LDLGPPIREILFARSPDPLFFVDSEDEQHVVTASCVASGGDASRRSLGFNPRRLEFDESILHVLFLPYSIHNAEYFGLKICSSHVLHSRYFFNSPAIAAN